jgi:hypothetical protein
MHARDERVRTLHGFPIHMKQHRLSRSNRRLANAVRVDSLAAIDATGKERRSPKHVSDEAAISNDDEIEQIVVFLRDALLDPRARPENLMKLIPAQVPSGRPVMVFEEPAVVASEDPDASGEEVALPSRRNPADASSFAHALAQNYPNPFNPSTTIAFTLAAETHVEVSIYDAAGTRIRTLVNERRPGGEYRVAWDGRTNGGVVAASGVYFYRLKTRDFTETRRMVLLR